MSWRVPYLANMAQHRHIWHRQPPFPSWFLFRRWFFKKSHDITGNGIAKWRDRRKMDCWLQFSSEIPWMDSGCGRLQVTKLFLSPTMTMSSAQIQAKSMPKSLWLQCQENLSWVPGMFGTVRVCGVGVGGGFNGLLVYQTYATAACSDINPISLKIYI